MVLSLLTPSDARAYATGQFTETPDTYLIDSPDPRVLPELGGWMPTANNEMYFKLTSYPNTTTSVGISALADSLVVNVKSEKRPTIEITYWKLNTGSDGRNSKWELLFDVYNDDITPDERYTGQWKFTKGKVNVDTV